MLEFRPNLLPLQTDIINNHQIKCGDLNIFKALSGPGNPIFIIGWSLNPEVSEFIVCWGARASLAVIMVVIKYNPDRQRLNYLCIGLSFPRPSWTLDTPIKCLGARSKARVSVWSLFSRSDIRHQPSKKMRQDYLYSPFICLFPLLHLGLNCVFTLKIVLCIFLQFWLRREDRKQTSKVKQCIAMEAVGSWWTGILQNCFVRRGEYNFGFWPLRWGDAKQ